MKLRTLSQHRFVDDFLWTLAPLSGLTFLLTTRALLLSMLSIPWSLVLGAVIGVSFGWMCLKTRQLQAQSGPDRQPSCLYRGVGEMVFAAVAENIMVALLAGLHWGLGLFAFSIAIAVGTYLAPVIAEMVREYFV